MFKHFTYVILICASALITHTAYAQDATASSSAAMDASAPRDPSLKPVYDEFGGKPGLVTLMNDFMDDMMADARTRPFFENADRDHIKAELVDQFCVILDGPCAYTGKDMATAHRKLGIDHADFNALVEDLQLAMNKNHIPFRAQNKLLAKLAPMHKTIITK